MSKVTISGSCLCGSVKYTVTGIVERFYHCHCQRCRKATGAEHASNLLISPATSIRWTCGEEHLKRHKVPDAERFYNCFCSQCGSPMPREVPELDGVLIPAGSLDTPAPIKPQARIFWDSRANWSSESPLPCYAEYPPME